MYNAVFISDVHLGTSQNSKEFLAFLRELKCKRLFLVGDIISFIVDTPNSELDELFDILKSKECEVVYLCGNHEKENLNVHSRLKHYYKEINLQDRYIYKFKNKNILIEHGDSFHYKDILNRTIKNIMVKYKVKIYKKDRAHYPTYRSLYYKIKPLIKMVLYKSYIRYMVKQAKRFKCNCVVCGHLHQPNIQKISNIEYINCGDWLKSCSYVALGEDGEFKLLYYK